MVNARTRRVRRMTRRRGRGRRGNIVQATRIAPQRVRIQRLPPAISMNANQCSLWIRSEITISTKIQAHNVGFNIKNLLDEMDALKIFNECRIKRVNFWFMSRLSITDTGNTAFCVVDEDVAKLSKIDFASVSCTPGSDVKRVYQTLAASWYPTEPQDRNWKVIDDTTFCSVYIATTRNTTENTINGSLIADAHLSLRGINNPRTTHPSRPSLYHRPLAVTDTSSDCDEFERLVV